VVIDASFVAAVLLEETHTAFVRAAFDDLAAEDLHAPALLPFELANILRTRTRKGELDNVRRSMLLSYSERLEVEIAAAPEGERMERILAVADRHGLTAYDAAYLEAALRLQADLATLDRSLAAAGRAEGLRVHAPF